MEYWREFKCSTRVAVPTSPAGVSTACPHVRARALERRTTGRSYLYMPLNYNIHVVMIPADREPAPLARMPLHVFPLCTGYPNRKVRIGFKHRLLQRIPNRI